MSVRIIPDKIGEARNNIILWLKEEQPYFFPSSDDFAVLFAAIVGPSFHTEMVNQEGVNPSKFVRGKFGPYAKNIEDPDMFGSSYQTVAIFITTFKRFFSVRVHTLSNFGKYIEFIRLFVLLSIASGEDFTSSLMKFRREVKSSVEILEEVREFIGNVKV